MNPVVRIHGLTKTFGATVACDDLTLGVSKGDILGLLGPSGCGKTTALRCVAGFETLTSGEIWLGDQMIASAGRSLPPEKRDIGMVFQSYALWPHLTVADNVAMPLRLRKVPTSRRAAMVDDIVERLGLGGLQRRYPAELSGGQQQRVAAEAEEVVVDPHPLQAQDAGEDGRELLLDGRRTVKAIQRDHADRLGWQTINQSLLRHD